MDSDNILFKREWEYSAEGFPCYIARLIVLKGEQNKLCLRIFNGSAVTVTAIRLKLKVYNNDKVICRKKVNFNCLAAPAGVQFGLPDIVVDDACTSVDVQVDCFWSGDYKYSPAKGRAAVSYGHPPREVHGYNGLTDGKSITYVLQRQKKRIVCAIVAFCLVAAAAALAVVLV